jgi:hypothetical protein
MPTTLGASSVQSRRPWQYIGLVQYPQSSGHSNYNGLQAKIQKQLSGGMTLLSAYTFSKSIDNTSGVRPGNGTSGNSLFPNNPFNLGKGERGVSNYDVRHRWITSGLIESPFGKGKRFNSNRLVNALFGSWQLGGILAVQTGSPATAMDGSDVTNIGNGATPRPNATGASTKISNPTALKWFNTSAFVINAPYTYGTASRNTINGPGLVQLDTSLMKSIVFADRVATQFRWDVFNAANHPIFGLPNATLNSASYGQISNTAVDSREMQVSLRVVF